MYIDPFVIDLSQSDSETSLIKHSSEKLAGIIANFELGSNFLKICCYKTVDEAKLGEVIANV